MAASVLYTNFGGMLVHEDRGGVHRTYAHDEMGNTSYLLDDNGITDSYEYTPYGTVRSHTGSNVTPFTFIGALGYFSTGLSHLTQYVRARWYSAKSGNWGTVDPLWPNEPAYGYVTGNPVMAVDPSGNNPSSLTSSLTSFIKKRLPFLNAQAAGIAALVWKALEKCGGAAMFGGICEDWASCVANIIAALLALILTPLFRMWGQLGGTILGALIGGALAGGFTGGAGTVAGVGAGASKGGAIGSGIGIALAAIAASWVGEGIKEMLVELWCNDCCD